MQLKTQNFKNLFNNRLALIKSYFPQQFFHCFSVFQLCLAGVLIGVYIIFARFATIKIVGLTQLSFNLVFFMIFGFLFGPIKGVLVTLIADTLGLLVLGSLHTWMWQYELVNMSVTLLACAYFPIIKLKQHSWFLLNILVACFTFLAFFITFTIVNFITQTVPSASQKLHNWTNLADTGGILATALLCLIIYVTLFVLYYKKIWHKKIKIILTLFSLTSLVLIIVSWIFGPFLYIAYFNRFLAQGSHYSLANYPYLLLPRILKGMVEIVVYTTILTFCYPVLKQLTFQHKNRWLSS